MPNPNLSQVQGVGDFSAVLTHPLIAGGTAVSLAGFKLSGKIVDSDQELDNAKVVPLVGGIAIVLTNTVKAGTLTWTAVKLSGDEADGDVVAISQSLIAQGDSVGGSLRISWGQNGKTRYVNFTGVVAKRCKPITLDGNDVPDYAVQWNYVDYVPGP